MSVVISRDGSRVAGFGGLSDYKLTIWDVEKQEKVITAVNAAPLSLCSLMVLAAPQLFGAEINNSCPCIAAE